MAESGCHASEPWVFAFSDWCLKDFLGLEFLLEKVFTAKDSSIHYITFFIPPHFIIRFILDFQVTLFQELLIILPVCLNFFDNIWILAIIFVDAALDQVRLAFDYTRVGRVRQTWIQDSFLTAAETELHRRFHRSICLETVGLHIFIHVT